MANDSTTQPKPACGQIWRHESSGAEKVVALAVLAPEGCKFTGAQFTDGTVAPLGPTWRCIGIETGHGRVMVGERRTPAFRSDVYEVVEIRERGVVGIAVAGHVYGELSSVVARWPLAAEPSPMATPERVAEAHAKGIAKLRAFFGADVDDKPLTDDDARDAVDRLGLDTKAWAADVRKRVAATIPTEREQHEDLRREIDALLREDAREHPAFATARRCAVLAFCEGAPPAPPSDLIRPVDVASLLSRLHAYERVRGAGSRPSEAAEAMGVHVVAVAAYERARRLP